AGIGVSFGAPAAELGIFLVALLGANEELAHLFVPVAPRFAAEVVHDLGGVVVIVNVLAIGRVRHDEGPDAFDQLRIGRSPAIHVLPAQEADRSHAMSAAGAGGVAVAVVGIIGHFQEGLGSFDGRGRDG